MGASGWRAREEAAHSCRVCGGLCRGLTHPGKVVTPLLGLEWKERAKRDWEMAERTGQRIAAVAIRRRFAAGLRNLERYKAGVDAWTVYNNAGSGPVLVEWSDSA